MIFFRPAHQRWFMRIQIDTHAHPDAHFHISKRKTKISLFPLETLKKSFINNHMNYHIPSAQTIRLFLSYFLWGWWRRFPRQNKSIDEIQFRFPQFPFLVSATTTRHLYTLPFTPPSYTKHPHYINILKKNNLAPKAMIFLFRKSVQIKIQIKSSFILFFPYNKKFSSSLNHFSGNSAEDTELLHNSA